MSSWLVIGGANERLAKLLVARGDYQHVIGCNRCLRWGIKPGVYWISDVVAVERYRADWEKYDGEIISNHDLGRPTTRFSYADNGQQYHGRSSGIMCARVAMERGATSVGMVGFRGNQHEDWWLDQFDKPVVMVGIQAARRNAAQSAALADIEKAHPGVEFTFYGDTILTVPERWRRVAEGSLNELTA